MRSIRIVAFAALIALLGSAPAQAQPADAGATVLQTLFTAKAVDPSLLDPAFAGSVPVASLQSALDDYRSRLGPLGSVAKSGSDYALTFARGALLATLTLDSAGKVSGLLLHDETSTAIRQALERFFTSKSADSDWFAPAFLAVIPIDQIHALVGQIVAQEGAYERVELRGGAFYAVFEKVENHATAALDDRGRFTALRLFPPVARTSNLDDALTRLAQPGTDLSYLVRTNDTDLAAAGADRPMAVGSAFKLVILAALRAEIQAGKHAWSDVVPLPASAKSLPSGAFQNWPDGLPVTLATYAAQMISLSDNTAADVLAGVVGRAALEALAPRNTPFLTTREMFALKTKDAALRAAYRAGALPARRALLATIDARPAPDVSQLELLPAYLDIEWYLSARELCALMDRVADLDLMTINPGIPSAGWKRIAYKGGSDAGVLNFTSHVTGANGASFCVTATWNDRTKSPDENAAIAAFGAVLQQLARR
jgi:beta-lactamase class A